MPAALTLTGQERFQVPGDDSIHRIVFWIARPIRGIKNQRASPDANRDAMPQVTPSARFKELVFIDSSPKAAAPYILCPFASFLR